MISYENYAKFRNSQGMRDSDVAKKAGIPQSTFSDWKKGKSTPKTDKIKKIADALNTTPSFIMGWTDAIGDESRFINELYDAVAENKKWTFLEEDEQELVTTYRNLDEKFKKELLLMIAFLKSKIEDKQ